VIVGGVTVSTILTMLVVPSLYLLIGGLTKPSTHVSDMLDRLRKQTGLRPHGEDRSPPPAPAE
jgi:multidrug efflux pump